jgi:uncharacterized protein
LGATNAGDATLEPLIFLEALALGVPVGLALGLVGGGGSILTVPILIGVFGLTASSATSVSLVIVAVNAASALRKYLRDGLVDLRLALWLTATGLIGSIAGTSLHHLVSPRVLTLAFAALMVLIAAPMLRSRNRPRADQGATQPFIAPWRVVSAGSLIGLTTGFFGVGGGFVIVPALLMLAVPMRRAVPTSLLVIALNSLVALGLRSVGGIATPLHYALPMILGGVAGSSLATTIAPRLGNAGLERAFAVVILALAVYLVFHALNG